MTKKELFVIILRVLGLFLFISSLFISLPSNLMIITIESDVNTILLSTASFLFLSGLFLCIVIYADRIVDWLRLENGLSDKQITFAHLKSKDIIKVALVLFGCYMILSNLTDFLYMSVFAFKTSIATMPNEDYEQGLNFNDYTYWIIYGVNILLGYLLITNVNVVSKFLNVKAK